MGGKKIKAAYTSKIQKIIRENELKSGYHYYQNSLTHSLPYSAKQDLVLWFLLSPNTL